MSLKTFYLDTNTYCEFVDKPERNSSLRALVRTRQRSNRCRILGSHSVIKEILCIPDEFARKRKAAFQLYWEFVDSLVLRDAAELFADEIRKSARLRLSEAILSESEAVELQNLTLAPPPCADVAMEAMTDEQNTANQFQETVAAAHEALIAHVGDESEARSQLARMTINEPTVQDWYEHSFRGFSTLMGEPIPTGLWAPVRNLPMTRAFVSFFLARVRRHHADLSKVRRGDRDDGMHYSYAAMSDALVTCDRTLKRIAESIEWNFIRVLNLAEFGEFLSGSN